LGYAGDGRVKPDAMAMGSYVAVVANAYSVAYSNGTSFACPILAGLTASLWGALPELNSYQILSLVRETSDRYLNPDIEYGYGIANIFAAYSQGNDMLTSLPEADAADACLTVYQNRIYLKEGLDYSKACLSVYNTMGIRLLHIENPSGCTNIGRWEKGLYMVVFQYNNKKYTKKILIFNP
jgi:hypothetical protein